MNVGVSEEQKAEDRKCSIWTGTLTSGEGEVQGTSREGVVADL